MPHALIFDVFGTLVDWRARIARIARKAAAVLTARQWDAVPGAEFARDHKPKAAVYLSAVSAFDSDPAEVTMVAAQAVDRVALSLTDLANQWGCA
jgi:FMN phosphatase YigB (HAD superfamily)